MPLPDAPPPWSTDAYAAQPVTPSDASLHRHPRPRSPGHSLLPPTLPPIARVSSDTDLYKMSTTARPASQGSRVPARVRTGRDEPSSYTGGSVLPHHFRPEERSVSTPSSGTVEGLRARRKPPPPPIDTDPGTLRRPVQPSPPRSAASFVAPTDRPSNQGMLSSSQAGSNNGGTDRTQLATVAPEAQKGKKGLPFLSSITKLLPGKKKKPKDVPSSHQPLPPARQPITADPRIHGTRVHDFSSPRARLLTMQETLPRVQAPVHDSMPHDPRAHASRGHDSKAAWAQRTWMEPPSHGMAGFANATPRQRPDGRDDMEQHMARGTPKETWGSLLQTRPESPPPAPVDKDSPRGAVPPVPPKDSSPASVRTSSSMPSRAPSAAVSDPNRSSSSTRTSISRNVSHNTTFSALPRHMKSTSSRFSFDMIGAANSERKMEERHRQLAQEKRISDESTSAPRDSRFDDFNDDFDYDAMMDDDGLDMEEEIPIVGNFDEDEYEEDIPLAGDFDDDATGIITISNGHDENPARPGSQYHLSKRMSTSPERGPTVVTTDLDDDQENFAGFHFQRSNPASSLASPLTPGVLPTPRDAEGITIGFAMTKDTTPDAPNSHSPLLPQNPPLCPPDEVSGPVTRSLQVDPAPAGSISQQCAIPEPPPPALALGDDFDYDDGLADELDFAHDGPAFDESIFDNNDTDQYGRPIPGAFDKAKQAMQAMHQPVSNRTSDSTSQAAFQSTASTTSASNNLNPSVGQEGLEIGAIESFLPPGIPGQDLAYQAALALAAQRAQASGKFRRSSSPPLPTDLTVTSPTESHVSQYQDGFDASALEDDLDDYEYDDDFIAEANASVLANDADGFYGQEFGFYSAPLPGKDYSLTASGAGGELSAENLSQYANGGFFCSGPARTKSGRVVSRDPNLTPITERSEYSNRNSIMSLTMPMGFGSDARSPPAPSPGLAQLAMSMTSDDMDHHKNLSDLLKLRSRAWGGSQASLPNSHEGSPRSEHAPLANGGVGMGSSPWSPPASSGLSGTLPNGRRGSGLSIWSTSEALAGLENFPASPISAVSPDGGPGLAPSPFSPPLAFAGPLSPLPPLNNTTTKVCSPVFEDDECRNDDPIRNGDDHVGSGPPLPPPTPASSKPARRPGIGHRHKGSADSISYTKEDEPESGGTIWVMERRRTADSGEVEILGREVVECGKI